MLQTNLNTIQLYITRGSQDQKIVKEINDVLSSLKIKSIDEAEKRFPMLMDIHETLKHLKLSEDI